MRVLKNRVLDFISDSVQWGSCLINIILCLCMAYFYYDSDLYIPLIYSIFFFCYVIVVFFTGKKFIPLLYLIYNLGAVQNITFINISGWFVIIGLSWWFPKWKIPLFVTYGLEIFLVCYRHNKSVWHLLAHFSFCIVFYFVSVALKKKVEKEAIECAVNDLKVLVEKNIENDIKNALREELRANTKVLELTSGEENVISQLADGKMIKEVEGCSKNTKTDYIESAMLKNGCKTKAELIALYALEQRLPDIFPSLFPEK